MYVIAFGMLFILIVKFLLLSVLLSWVFHGVEFLALRCFYCTKSSNAQIAARLSALAQGFGYLIAAQGQWIIGFCMTI